MAGALQKFVRGAAGTASQLYADQAMSERKSRLTAARDKKLNSFAKALQTERLESAKTIAANRLTAQQESPTQRLAQSKLDDRSEIRRLGEAYQSATTDEEKQQIRESIGLMKGTIGKKYLSAGTRVFDLEKGEFLSPPANESDMRKTAAKMATDIYKANAANIRLKVKPTKEEIYNSALEMLQGKAEYESAEEVVEAYKNGEIATWDEASELLKGAFGATD